MFKGYQSKSIGIFILVLVLFILVVNSRAYSQENVMEKAEKLFHQGNYDDSITILSEYINKFKNSVSHKKNVSEAHYLLAKVYFTVGEDKIVDENLEKAFKLYPAFEKEETDLEFKDLVDKIKAKATSRQGKTVTLLIPTGKSIMWYIDRGDEFFDKQEYMKAKLFFQMVLQIDKLDPVAKLKIKECEKKLYEKKEEKKFYNYLDRADLYLKKNQVHYALNYFLVAYKIFPPGKPIIADRMKKISTAHPTEWKLFFENNQKKIKEIIEISAKTADVGSTTSGKVPFNKVILKKTKSVKQNKKGFWEVGLHSGHILVYIPTGSYSMGSGKHVYVKMNPREGVIRTQGFAVNANEIPQHEVDLDGFFMAKYEITNEQYASFLNDMSAKLGIEKAYAEHWILYYGVRLIRISFNLDSKIRYNQNAAHGKKFYVLSDYHSSPVYFVTWSGAQEFCKWFSKKTTLKFRLPTEAEWEKAARGKEIPIFPWGNQIAFFEGKYYANFNQKEGVSDGFVDAAPVNSFTIGQSPYGILNMAGNVSEWLLDWYQRDFYRLSPRKNPKHVSSATNLNGITRGGGWKSDIFDLRTTRREKKLRNRAYQDVGFRIVLEDK